MTDPTKRFMTKANFLTILTAMKSKYTNKNAFGRVAAGGVNIDADAESDTLNIVGGTNVTVTPDASTDTLTISSADTHHEAYLRAGASGGTANAATTSGSTYLNLVENGSNRSGIHLIPGDNTTIVSDGLGNVTFQSSDTKYGLELNGNTLSLVEGGTTSYVGLNMGTLAYDQDSGRYINESIQAWLANLADGRQYGVSIPKSSATTCTKTGANAAFANPMPGIVGRPAVDPYVGVGPFFFVEANGGVESDGTPYVTAIRGVDTRFRRDGTNGDVVILTPVLCWSMEETETTMELVICDTKYQTNAYQPQAYLPDGTLRPYMLYAKYAGGMYGGVYSSVSGVKPRNRDVSHDTLITITNTAGSGYSGKSIADDWYVKVMFLVKYATKHSQSVMAGCTNYNYQYAPSVAESNVKRVILTNAQAANLLVGSAMMLGTHTGASDNDRNRAQNYDVFDGAVITSIDTYDSGHKAVSLDTDGTFSTHTTDLFSTSPWFTGSCDDVEGDGSRGDNLSGKYPCVIQGIECFVGFTEILGDVIIKSDGSTGWIPFINYDSRNETTSVTANYTSSGKSLPCDTADSWKYPLYPENGGGLLFGTTTGGSQSIGLCDGHYTNKRETAGTREWRSFGNLSYGGFGGAFYVNGSSGLSGAGWLFGSRRSYSGRSRG